MLYSTNYDYNLGNGEVQERDSACFGSLFSIMYDPKLYSGHIKVYTSTKKIAYKEHKMSFTEEEVRYVFDRLKNIFEYPVITKTKQGFEFDITFTDRTSGYVKFLLTVIRYFYETQQDKSINSCVKIMRSTIDYSKKHPEVPFIEVMQLFHYDDDRGSGHSIVNHSGYCVPRTIVSEATLIPRLSNSIYTNINYASSYSGNKALFEGFKYDRASREEIDNYIDSFDKIERI